MRADDAVRAVEHGVDAIIVSNHGGRQLDHAAVDDRGAAGDRRGGRRPQPRSTSTAASAAARTSSSALALGARAVLIGRPMVYGLGAAGEAGARRAFEMLRGELPSRSPWRGYPRVAELGRTRSAIR